MDYSKLKRLILDLFFQINCLGCGQADNWLCDNCLANISRFEEKFFPPLKPNFLDQIVIVANYDDFLLRTALHCFKYKFVVGLGEDLANLVNQSEINKFKDYLVVPIPLHKKRLKLREFNQAEVFATAISQKFDLKIDPKILIRVKSTVSQMTLNRVARLENVKNIFRVEPEALGSFSKVLLVDDVLTTGATLNEAAKVLKEAGVKKVAVLVVAHGT